MPKKQPNSKAVAGNLKKAENETKKKAARDAELEKERAADWAIGSNLKGAARKEASALKADEAARKKREKAELLAAEEAEMGSFGKVKSAPKTKKGGKKKNDLSMLEDALVSGAEKKVKAKKKAELAKKEAELAKKQEAEAKRAKEEASVDPLLRNTAEMIGEGEGIGRAANKATMKDGEATGIDAALDSLTVGAAAGDVKSQKALYNAFEERMLPKVKEDYPGLRLTQYKERIFALWKKSPENPKNQLPQS